MKRQFFKSAIVFKPEPLPDDAVRCNACAAAVKVKDLADHKRLECPMRDMRQSWKCYTKVPR